MIGDILWIVSFFSLWLITVWLQIIYFDEPKKQKKIKFPSVTVAVAAYNEEKTIEKTINSLVRADYPKDKVEIIVVNDGSTDGTAAIVNSLINKHSSHNIRLITKKNGGKASAINTALDNATCELFGVVDADSRIEPNCLKLVIPHFTDNKIGAVISRVRVDKPKKMLDKVQRFEYIMSSMIRKLMATIGTLAITPGVLSVYRTPLLKKLGGFDESEDNLTEDLEIAMRLKYHGYKVKMEHNSIVHTVVPQSVNALWRQRIRWARGYIHNHWKYRKMFFSRKHSLFGIFQMPVNVMVVLLLILNVSIISYVFLNDAIEFTIRSVTMEGYLVNKFLSLPSIKEIVLGQNFRIVFPVIICSLLSIYIIFMAHRIFKERLTRNIVPVMTYFIFVPYFMTLNWISSIAQEILRKKKKW